MCAPLVIESPSGFSLGTFSFLLFLVIMGKCYILDTQYTPSPHLLFVWPCHRIVLLKNANTNSVQRENRTSSRRRKKVQCWGSFAIQFSMQYQALLWKDAIQFLRRSWFSCSITGAAQKIPWQQTSGLEEDDSEKKEVWYKKIEGI